MKFTCNKRNIYVSLFVSITIIMLLVLKLLSSINEKRLSLVLSIMAPTLLCQTKVMQKHSNENEIDQLLVDVKLSNKTGCEFGCEKEWFNKPNLDSMNKTQSNIRQEKVGGIILEYLDTVQTPLNDFKAVGVGTSFPLRIAGICSQIPSCSLVAAVEPSQKALIAGIEMVKEVAPCATYLPIVKTINQCTPSSCLVSFQQSFDLVSAVQVVQHVSRRDYPLVFSNLHNLVRSGGGVLLISEEAGFPLVSNPRGYDLQKEGLSKVIPFLLRYRRMSNCLNAEVFGMWFVLTGRYDFKVLKCSHYVPTKNNAKPYEWYSQENPNHVRNTESKKKNILEILPWYANKIKYSDLAPLSWEVPGLKEYSRRRQRPWNGQRLSSTKGSVASHERYPGGCPVSHKYLEKYGDGDLYWCYSSAGNVGPCRMSNSGYPAPFDGEWGKSQNDCVVEQLPVPPKYTFNQNLSGRYHFGNNSPYDAMESIGCTSVIVKKDESSVAHLPPFEEQIRELMNTLKTIKWDDLCTN